jgi:two-component system, cell cycle response regulator CpdR
VARILVVDDEVPMGAFLQRALTRAGHDVATAPDGLAAIAALAAAPYDVMLSDIVMPGLDGIALALKAGKEYPAMKILLMSGYDSERQRAHNLEALAHGVVAKPFSVEEICAAVAAALAL